MSIYLLLPLYKNKAINALRIRILNTGKVTQNFLNRYTSITKLTKQGKFYKCGLYIHIMFKLSCPNYKYF